MMISRTASTERIGVVYHIAANADNIDGTLFTDHRAGFIIHQNDNHRVVIIVLANRMSSVHCGAIGVHMSATIEGRCHRGTVCRATETG